MKAAAAASGTTVRYIVTTTATLSHPALPLDDILELLYVGRLLHEGQSHDVHSTRHDQRKVEVSAVLPHGKIKKKKG